MPGKPTNEPLNYIAVGVQPAHDTESTEFYFLKHLDGSGFEVNQEIQSEREGGDGQEIGLRYKSGIRANGALVNNARPEAAARDFAYTLGGESVASVALGASQVQKHTAFPVASLPELTMDQRWADEIERTTNVRMTQLTVEGEAGRPLKITNNFMAGGSIFQREIASSLTPVRETARPFFYAEGSYQFDGAASYARKVTKFKLEVNRALDDNIQTTGLNLEDVVPLNFDVNFDGTIKYESRDFYRKVQYSAAGSQVPVDLATGTFEAVVFTGSQMLRMVLPFLQWTDVKVNKLDPDGKTVYLDVVAMGLKNATHQIFTEVHTQGATSYLVGA